MADYSKQLFDMFGSFGDTARDNRLENRQNMESDRNYAHTLERFQHAKDVDQRDYDRGVLTSDRNYNRGVYESDRGYGLQERNYQRGVLESDRNYELARQAAERRDAPRIDTFFDPATGREIKGVYDSNAPGGFVPVGGAKAAPVARGAGMTTVDKKAILDADEGVQAGENVVGALTRAKELNTQAYSGPLAGARGYVSSLWGNDSGEATEELGNLVTAQALDQLKAVFGGMPTEGERKILLDIQGSVNQSPEVRKRIYDRAIVAAQKRIDFNRATASSIRSGDYFGEGGGPASGGGLAPGVEDGGYIFRGGDPSDPNSWEPVR